MAANFIIEGRIRPQVVHHWLDVNDTCKHLIVYGEIIQMHTIHESMQ